MGIIDGLVGVIFAAVFALIFGIVFGVSAAVRNKFLAALGDAIAAVILTAVALFAVLWFIIFGPRAISKEQVDTFKRDMATESRPR